MASTYTANSGIELIGSGEQSGTWGVTTNNNLSIVDRLANGVGAITLVGTTHLLTTTNGQLSDGQYRVLVFDGSLVGTNTVTVTPNDAQHLYFVKNTTTESVVLTQGSGTSVTVAAGKSAIVYTDGGGTAANAVDLSSTFDSYDLPSTLNDIAGLSVADGNFIVGNGATWVAESGDTALTSLGVTATGTELNILDGATVTTAELNILDGVTATAAELNILDGVTATTDELNILDGVTATTDELNILDGVTATTAELNYNDITTLGTSQASKVVTADANGDVFLSEELKAKSYNETFVSLSGTTPSIDCETANAFALSTTGNTTFTFTNPPASGTAYSFILRITAGGTHTVGWPVGIVSWPAATAPAPDAPASGETNVYVFHTTTGGTTWYGFLAGADMS